MNNSRPTMRSPEIVAAAAEKLLPEILGWARDVMSGQDRDYWLKALTVTLMSVEHKGTFELCKEFEINADTDGDDDLYCILDNAYFLVSQIHREAEKKWFADSGLALRFRVGDVVQTPKVSGKIVSLDTIRGYYAIRESGRDSPGYIGTLCPFELVDG